MEQTFDRPVYARSGRWDASRLPSALALLAACTAGIVVLYCVQIYLGLYLCVLSVFWPAALVGWGIRATAKQGHWRNPILAGALGMTCGLTGFLGYFHADQCLRWGVPWSAIERLPDYLAFRVETDDWQFVHKGAVLRPQQPKPGIRPQRPLAGATFQSWNGAGFAFEALALALTPLVMGFLATREPYSESRRRWCRCEQLTLAPLSVAALRQSLANGTVDRWVDAGPRKVGAHQKHGKVRVWYTPAEEGEEADADVFVSIGAERALLLLPEEAAALASLLPGVRDLAGPALEQQAAEAEQSADPTSARVWPVPPPYAGQAQNRRNRRRGRLLILTLGILPLPLITLLLLGGGWFLYTLAVGNNMLPTWSLAVYVVVAGLSCLLFAHWWYRPGNMEPLTMRIRFDYGQLRRAVAARPQPLVAADDPRAVFAEMRPRKLWSGGRVKCGDYNQGLLLVDSAKRGILFEGDYECYWIPAASIQACDVEALSGTVATMASFWAVVLRVRLGGGNWEFPFFPKANIAGHNRWDQALLLLRQIEGMSGRVFANQPSAPPRTAGPIVVG